jgi:hypothetical protein
MSNTNAWLDGLRWVRDQLPARIATFWMIAAFYALGFGLVLAFFQIDAEFSRPLAGGVVPPEVTQHLAWAVRAFSVIVGMAAMYCHVNAMPKFRNMMAVLGGVAAVLLFLHALGISAKIMEGQYGRAAAIGQIETATTGTSATQIATLQKQIDDITKAKDARVDRLQRSIDGIVNDGLNNDELADDYRVDQTAAENAADAEIKPLREQITALTTKTGETVVKATEDKTKVDSFNPLFTFMARVASWTWNPAVTPSETLQFGFGFLFLTLFFGFGEVLMMACFTVAYGMQLVVASRREQSGLALDEAAGPTPPGFTDMRFTNEEWAEYERAMEVHKNIKAGAKKGTTTKRRGNKIEAADDYYRDRISAFPVQHNEGLSTAQIAAKAGLTVASLRMSYAPHMTQEEQAALFGSAFVPEPEQEPPVVGTGEDPEPPVAMTDSPQEPEPDPELDIPPEPQEWPVANYEPPANDDPQDKDAA